MVAKKILTLAGDYVGDYEIMVPFQALQTVDHQVRAVYPDERAGQSVRIAIHDFEGSQTYSEKPGHNFALNADFAQAHVEDHNALLIPGGRAPEYLRPNEQVLALVRVLDAAHKPIAAVCHDTQLLAAADVLQRQACSVYPVCTPEVRLVDGEYVDIPSDQTRINSRPVTAPAWPAHPA